MPKYIYRKTATAILTAGTGFHTVFQVDYGDHDHVFSDIQKWYQRKVDHVLLGDVDLGSASANGSSSGAHARPNIQESVNDERTKR